MYEKRFDLILKRLANWELTQKTFQVVQMNESKFIYYTNLKVLNSVITLSVSLYLNISTNILLDNNNALD